MVPGSLGIERPGDLWVMTSENIGGGALHALGEGYLISGILGIILVSIFMGMLAAFPAIVYTKVKSLSDQLSLMLLAFPWLLLIRGGWYQFFAMFKSLSIFFCFIILILVIRLVRLKLNSWRGN
jgi:hypothetical protein